MSDNPNPEGQIETLRSPVLHTPPSGMPSNSRVILFGYMHLHLPKGMKALKSKNFYETHITDNLSYRVLILITTELLTMTAGMEMGMDMKTTLYETMLSTKKV